MAMVNLGIIRKSSEPLVALLLSLLAVCIGSESGPARGLLSAVMCPKGS